MGPIAVLSGTCFNQPLLVLYLCLLARFLLSSILAVSYVMRGRLCFDFFSKYHGSFHQASSLSLQQSASPAYPCTSKSSFRSPMIFITSHFLFQDFNSYICFVSCSAFCYIFVATPDPLVVAFAFCFGHGLCCELSSSFCGTIYLIAFSTFPPTFRCANGSGHNLHLITG